MSVVRSIYNALEAVAVTDGSNTITCYDLDELPKSIDTAILPCRLLLPIGNNPGEGREGVFIAVGTTMTINWQLTDLMLWDASEQGSGLAEFAPQLVSYCGRYIDAMRSFRMPVADTALESVEMVPGMYEWPIGSGRFFSGVMCNLVIREALNG